MNFEIIERKLGYVFKNKQLLKKAFTLSSAGESYNNETLEFLGDAILGFIVSEKIFAESNDEGNLTKKRAAIVSGPALAPVSQNLGLDGFLIRGKGDGNNKKAVPSVFEAIVAAIYLDGGLNAAKEFVLKTLNFAVKGDEENYKGKLQEWLQPRGKELPDYSDCKESILGQNHDFEITVTVEGKTFTGHGATKRQAEQSAAKAAFNFLKNN